MRLGECISSAVVLLQRHVGAAGGGKKCSWAKSAVDVLGVFSENSWMTKIGLSRIFPQKNTRMYIVWQFFFTVYAKVALELPYVLLRSGPTFCYVPSCPVVFPAREGDSLRGYLGAQKTNPHILGGYLRKSFPCPSPMKKQENRKNHEQPRNKNMKHLKIIPMHFLFPCLGSYA